MPHYTKLQIGDMSENGQITIIDEDRLCYIVKSESRGASGLRTISKALLKEFVAYMESHPETPANDVRFKLSGLSDIDKYEYGYGATLVTMAKMILGQTEIIRTINSADKTLLFPPCIENKEGISGFLNRAIPIVLERDSNFSRLDKYASIQKDHFYSLGHAFFGRAVDSTVREDKINSDIEWHCNIDNRRYYLYSDIGPYYFDSIVSRFNEAYKGIFEIVIDTIDYNGAERKRYSLYAVSSDRSLMPNQPLQQIFYGAPGTGKSHTIKKTTDGVDSKFVVRTTFHPDSDYSTFVGAYKPKMEVMPRYNPQTGEQMGVEKRIVYAYTPQAFLKAYITAWQNPEQPVYLIIEEINRGNCAQIFGDLFQLLDRGDDGQSCYPIKADQDMQMHLMEEFVGYDALPENIRSGEELVLPSNLYIWATMNTSDQSLFPIDSAFKRRWEWKYIPITQGKDKESGKLMQWSIEAEGVRYDWWSFLEVMNKRVGDITSSEDKKLGFFFCKADGQGIISADKFVSKVMFYLWNDVFKDYPDNPIAMYLKEEGGEFTYGDFYTTNAGGDVVVREELVTRLLDALGVKVVSVNEDEDENNSVDQEAEDSSTRKFSIIFADGTEVLEDRQFGSYAKALARIGLDKVEPIAAHLKYSRLGCPLVSKEEYDEILDNAQGYSYVNIDGYYIIKGINLRTMRNFLTQVSEELGLGLKLEVK